MKLLKYLFLLLIAVSTLQAYTITTFAGSVYNTNTAVMDATLGIDDGFTVEDFEDSTLIEGLNVTFTDGRTTPNLSTASYYWDGSQHLQNYTNGPWVGVTFSFDESVSVFAVGTSYFDTGNGTDYIYLNGSSTPLTNLQAHSGFVTGSTRNLYIIIEAGAGETIESVYFPSSNSGSDRINFDHLAVKAAVPEPSSLFLLLTFGIISLFGIYKK